MDKGFTLLELLLVVALAGMLAAMAWPSYQQHLYTSRRSDAWSAILAIRLAQEKWRNQNAGYTSDLKDLAIKNLSEQGFYQLKLDTNASASAFTIRADAVSTGAQNQDTGCTQLIFSQQAGEVIRQPVGCWPAPY